MTRQTYDRELQILQDDVLALGSMVGKAILESVESLKKLDAQEARRLVAQDSEINRKRYAIEADALSLIATQQPMAGDLRIIAAVLDIAGQLERMGDYAKGISRINLMMEGQTLLKPLCDIPLMADKATSMLNKSLEAFAKQDADSARNIPRQDDEVDDLYNQVYRELISLIIENPRNINRATYLLWVAHNLERFADRVTNICERVIFTATGELPDLSMESGHARIS
jgi:phosphate transport system protein